jgi:hypothetical protein
MPPLDSGGTETEISRILKERFERLRTGLEVLTREFLESLPPASTASLSAAGVRGSGELFDSDFLAESVRALAASEDQIALLDRLLEGAARCFSRVCLFIVREDTAHGWSSVGLPETDHGDPVKGLVVSLREDSLLRAATDTQEPARCDTPGAEARFLPAPRPGDRLPEKALAVPLRVKDKVAAVLYADDGGDGRSGRDFGSVEILTSVASLVANRLALLSRPAGEEMEARAEVQVQFPRASDGEGFPAGPDPFGPDPLEEDLSTALVPGTSSQEPGAFSPEEKLIHEDARRFARLLVSEILLYHEDQVILGRKQRDIYSRLKEEIDRSRQAYDQRIPRNVSARTDYFKEEMIRTLAGGDSVALGPGLAL